MLLGTTCVVNKLLVRQIQSLPCTEYKVIVYLATHIENSQVGKKEVGKKQTDTLRLE